MYLGQLFHVSSATSAPGEKIRLEISLDSATAERQSALKWEVVFPAQLLELEGDGPEIGGAAMDSGKSLQCTAGKPYSYVCILSAGRNRSQMARLRFCHFKIRTTAKAGTAAVRIENAAAVTVDSKELTLENAGRNSHNPATMTHESGMGIAWTIEFSLDFSSHDEEDKTHIMEN